MKAYVEELPLEKRKNMGPRTLKNYYDLEEGDKFVNDRIMMDFNLEDLIVDTDDVFDSSIIIYGPRRTGKSTLLLHILTFLQNMKKIGRIAVFTSTDMNNFYKAHIPDSTTFGVEDAGENIEKIMEFMRFLIEEDIDDGILRQYTIVLDDFSWNKKFAVYDQTFAKLFTTARHYNMSVIILIQNPTGAMNWVRNNADFSFILKTPGFDAKERIWKDQLDFINKKEAFKFMDDNTLNFQAIVVKRTDPNAEINERVFTYTADLIDIGGKHPTKQQLEKRTKFGDPKWRKKMDTERFKKPKKLHPYSKGSEIEFNQISNALKRTGPGSMGFKIAYNSLC